MNVVGKKLLDFSNVTTSFCVDRTKYPLLTAYLAKYSPATNLYFYLYTTRRPLHLKMTEVRQIKITLNIDLLQDKLCVSGETEARALNGTDKKIEIMSEFMGLTFEGESHSPPLVKRYLGFVKMFDYFPHSVQIVRGFNEQLPVETDIDTAEESEEILFFRFYDDLGTEENLEGLIEFFQRSVDFDFQLIVPEINRLFKETFKWLHTT